jgi:hypothetical protein
MPVQAQPEDDLTVGEAVTVDFHAATHDCSDG